MMRIFLVFIFTFISANSHAVDNSYLYLLPNHQLHIVLHPEQRSLEGEDQITVPRGSPRTINFSLHRDLNPTSIDAEIKFIGKAHEPWLWQYSVTPRKGHNSFTISYAGEIYHLPQQEAREERNFQNTPGIIDEDGVVLNGESGWYPRLELIQSKGMLTFNMEVEQPKNWRTISQGARKLAKDGDVVWRERQPQSEIHLIAGYFNEYDLTKNGVQAMVYLRNKDTALAQRYLEATARYIGMYQGLIGPYAYAKFALVENFWETGYGMPSFSLMGSQVIRLPFIIDSSYPHEILHNWWGNSVYVDYEKGNWSEGLTAYLADHLVQEQKGRGAEYRRSILQKYADFASAERDFPLTQFTSRNSASSEAVGYGKAMMMFHMLRREMENDRFVLALQGFYKTYQFKQATYSDIEEFFSQASGKNLKPFFAQWTQQTGAPQLRLVSAHQESDREGYELIVKIEQTQPGTAYLLDVPIVVTMAGEKDAYSTVIKMTSKQAEMHIPLTAKPLRIDVDPEFDIFRRLDNEEMSAAFSQVMGAEKLLIVLPRKASEEMRTQYADIAKTWQQQPSRTTLIKWDDELERLPAKDAVWLFGWENKFRGEFQAALDSSVAKLTDAGAELDGKKMSRETDALAISAQIGAAPVAWMAASEAKMLPILARKLPHYAKYSYAAFNGEVVVDNSTVQGKQSDRSWFEFPRPSERSVGSNVERTKMVDIYNIAKGIWPMGQSPLTMLIPQANGTVTNVIRGELHKRPALAQ